MEEGVESEEECAQKGVKEGLEEMVKEDVEEVTATRKSEGDDAKRSAPNYP